VYEHNDLHHYKLGEARDPDQPELNSLEMRISSLPRWARHALVLVSAMTWKFSPRRVRLRRVEE
jgi:hypothetical protein